MKKFAKIDDIKHFLEEKRSAGQTIGFVPTMGALHPGHISLIERAVEETDVVVASIFVNPTQFNNPDDLKNYPRMPEADAAMLESAGTSVLFMPEVEEMYSTGFAEKPQVDLGDLEKVMEGAHRSGHFAGVVQVVSKLFDIVNPDRSYFGEKDYQQLAVIRRMTTQLRYRTAIIGCPTVREADGLAMSSRNLRLSPEERQAAAQINRTLHYIKQNFRTQPTESLLAEAATQLLSTNILHPEYLEIADAETLQSVRTNTYAQPVRVFAAVFCGAVRLIDNMGI